MTSKQGRTTRKKRPQPTSVEEPLLIVNCLCPSCNASFTQRDLKGGYLNRACPKCGCSITMFDFDAKAALVIAKRSELTRKLEELTVAKERIDERVNKTRLWILKPLNLFFKKKQTKLKEQLKDLKRKIKIKQKQLNSIAKMRYYTSEFHQRSHSPLERKQIEPFALAPFYKDDGLWTIPRGKKELSGFTAEIMAFNALERCVRDPKSPLYKAQLLPNLFINKQNPYGKSFWSQIDCLILTRQAAFVLEIKRRYGHIISNAPFTSISNTKVAKTCDQNQTGSQSNSGTDQDSHSSTVDDSWILSQNSEHAVVFSEICSTYPFEKVFEQVVFVSPRTFSSDCSSFVDNVNVGCWLKDAPAFYEAIEEQCRELPEIISQEELDELAERLLEAYGDLNQKRWLVHKNRLS